MPAISEVHGALTAPLPPRFVCEMAANGGWIVREASTQMGAAPRLLAAFTDFDAMLAALSRAVRPAPGGDAA